MGWLLNKLADFIGRVLAKLIAPLGREIRKNRTGKQTGADDETLDTIDDDVWDAATSDRVQRDIRSQDRTPP